MRSISAPERYGWRETVRTYGRGVALVFAPSKRIAAVVVCLTLVTSLLPVLQPWLLKLVVDRLGGVPGAASDAAAGGLTVVLALAGCYALTLVVPAAVEPVRQTVRVILEDQAVGSLDRQVIEAGKRLIDLGRIERPAFHDEADRVRRAAESVPRFASAAEVAAGIGLTQVGLLVVLGQLHPLIPVALAATVVPHLVAERRMHRLQFQTMAEQSRAAREMDYCVRLTTQPAGAKEVRTFGLGGWFLDRYRTTFAEAHSEVRAARLRHLRSAAAFSILHAAALVGGFWYVAAQTVAGQLGLGDIALYVNAVILFEGELFLLGMHAGMLHEMGLYFRQLRDFDETAGPTIALPERTYGRHAPVRLRDGIDLEGVEFRYPEGSEPVLRDVNAALRAGQVTALVGANGAGKSTLVKLLTRMYDPTGGQLRADGMPLSAYDLDSLRGRIGTVYQDFARFSLTAGENIGVGEIGARDLAERVRTAARKAGADAVVAKLPDGYATHLTRLFDGGVELSGGEWQKIATARGFLRDAALVILDEPTAALDADAERRLFDEFRSLMAGRTALLISHRFSTVRMADHILVVDDGRITEAGSHDELIALDRTYARLFELQAGRYR
ncbi:MAG: ABC transporter ATP-binding protein [Actinopolymorphaceae bacterium]